jgi:hypothetical protein
MSNTSTVAYDKNKVSFEAYKNDACCELEFLEQLQQEKTSLYL